jgi:uncharacterized protein (DUF1501 family)
VACDDFCRSELLRRAAAEAGRGLPAVERGMPVPAGTGLDRRSFLARSAGLALAVYGGSKLGFDALDEGIAHAAGNAGAVPARQRVLVSVFLDGGADSMSILFPAGDPAYRKLRPNLALPGSAGQPFAEDERLRWHPAALPLAELHREGKVAVLPAVGYTDANQSHFTSRHFWEVGATSASLRTGWLGRYLDVVGTQDNPLQGLSLDHHLQPSLAAGRVPVATVESPKGYDFWARGVWGDVQKRMLDSIGTLGTAQAPGDPATMQAAAAAFQTDQLRRQLTAFAGGSTPPSPVAYPNPNHSFSKRLSSLAGMIAAGLPLHCVALQAPGSYDTHDDQVAELTEGLTLTSSGLLAFQRDLEARGIADRVVTLVWTEFGRRAEENGSAGTDHGAAGIAFVIGQPVRGQMVGEFPGLSDGLDREGNLRPTADYRSLYSALLEQWFETDAAAVIPGASRFARPSLIAA